MVLQNHSSKVPFTRTALVALSYRCSMARRWLTPMLCFLMVAHKMVEIFLVLQVLFAEDSKVDNICYVVLCPSRKPACSSAMMFSRLWLKPAKDYL